MRIDVIHSSTGETIDSWDAETHLHLAQAGDTIKIDIDLEDMPESPNGDGVFKVVRREFAMHEQIVTLFVE